MKTLHHPQPTVSTQQTIIMYSQYYWNSNVHYYLPRLDGELLGGRTKTVLSCVPLATT